MTAWRIDFHRRALCLTAGVAAAAVLTACNEEPKPDAFGNFEAIEVVVSAQSTGQLQLFTPLEGARLDRDAVVAVVDTTQLVLEREQLMAQTAATRARRKEVTQQIDVLQVQEEISRRVYDRTTRLHDRNAATAQQLDQAERDYRTLVAQIEAMRAQRATVELDVAANDARVSQIDDLIARSTVTNPVPGTVLATYARAGEVVKAGQPLYKIADLDKLVLRAYLSGAQLGAVKLGQVVRVHVDRGSDSLATIPGTVIWISPTAEFTPTPVQTREERGDLVYAVKVRVRNAEGQLRIGMPADVTFGRVIAGDGAADGAPSGSKPARS